MSESDLLFDTWAWWELLHATRTGSSLARRFVRGGRYRLHTSAITFGELSSRLHADGVADRIAPVCGAIRRASHVWNLTSDLSQEAGIARQKLRETAPAASLADAIVYVTARRASARIVSADPAFRGVPGVISG